jgi:tetratricopeptide (TPR) repeat protein
MRRPPEKMSCYLILKRVSLLFLFLLILARGSYAVELVYSIQTGSFTDLSSAEKQFNLLKKGLKGKDADFLRVEKIGKFYSVRIGKFDDRSSAEALRKSALAVVSSAITMDVYFKEDRIVKIIERPSPEVSTPPGTAPEEQEAVPKIEEPVKQAAIPEAAKTSIKETIPEAEVPVEEIITAAVPKPEAKHELGTFKIRLREISTMVNNGNYDEALEMIISEMDNRPDTPELIGWYGVVLLKKDDPEQALQYFTKASELSPMMTDYHNGGGYCLYYLERFDEALEAFNRAISLEPENSDAITGLGLTYSKKGQRAKAMSIYNRLKEIDREAADLLFKVIKRQPS